MSVGFAIGWLVCSILWFITYWGSMIIAAIIMGIATGIVSYIQYKREGRVGLEPKRRTTGIRKPEPKGYQSRAQKARVRRSEVASGKVKSGWTRMSGSHTCSIRCRDSRMPKRFCRCACGGQRHGEHRNISTQVTAALLRQREAPPRPAAVRKPAPAPKPTVKKPTIPKTDGKAPGWWKGPEVEVPEGKPDTPCWVTWYSDNGETQRAHTTLATARILKQRGRLTGCGTK
jgi:hypothetical protein